MDKLSTCADVPKNISNYATAFELYPLYIDTSRTNNKKLPKKMCKIISNNNLYESLHEKNGNDCVIEIKKDRKRMRKSSPLKVNDSINTLSQRDTCMDISRVLQVTCALCECSFENMNALYKHMKTSHDTCHYCELCDEEFTTSKSLLCHKNKNHGKKGSNKNSHHINKHVTESNLMEIGNSIFEDEMQTVDETLPDVSTSEQVLHAEKIKMSVKELSNTISNSSMSFHLESYFMCEVCEQIFTDISQLSDHIIKEHTKTSENETFGLDNMQVLQSQNISEDMPVFSSQYEDFHLDEEEEQYIDVEPVLYSYMTEDLTDNAVTTSEKDEYHTMYHCSYCTALFDKVVDYFDHKKLHDSTVVFVCVACKQEFQSEFSFIQHKKFYPSHFFNSNGKPFECDMCGQRFKHVGNLTKHRVRHRPYSTWEYKCRKCEKKFETNRVLSRHFRDSHPPESAIHKNMDEICVTDKQTLKNTSLNKLPCMHCGESFTKMCDFVLHQNCCHNIWKIFKCVSCNQEFYSERTYNKHKKYHDPEFSPTGATPFECDLCPRKYSRFGSLSQHRLCHKRHTVGQRECGKCNIQYKSPTELFYHIVRCHKEMFSKIGQKKQK